MPELEVNIRDSIRAAQERKGEVSADGGVDTLERIVEQEEIESSSRKRKVEGKETRTKKTKLVTSTPHKGKDDSGSDLLSMEESDIDSSDEEHNKKDDAGFVTFNAQKYLQLQKKKKVIVNEYYAVDYGKIYIGRVQEYTKTSVKMTFLARKPDDRYDWPRKEDSDSNIQFKYIFAGPIKMVGTTPFHIKGVDEAYKLYIKFCKQTFDK